MNGKYIPVCKDSGLYHTPKVQYCEETKNYVKSLLDESKLSIVKKSILNNIVENGGSLPRMVSYTDKQISIKNYQPKPKSSKKRSIRTILLSGAYERDLYSPANNKANHDIEKTRLQSLMAYGKDLKMKPDVFNTNEEVKTKSRKEITNNDMFEDLVYEIEERDQFLKDMELLGEGQKYKDVIENEIFAKMRQLKLLDEVRYANEEGTVKYFRNMYKRL